jgi:hypothetical protein
VAFEIIRTIARPAAAAKYHLGEEFDEQFASSDDCGQ